MDSQSHVAIVHFGKVSAAGSFVTQLTGRHKRPGCAPSPPAPTPSACRTH
jgi:hypothetical protein